MTNAPRHPLSPLDRDEILAARQIVFDSGRVAIPLENVRFAYVGLFDPPKAVVHAYDRGEDVAIERRVRFILVMGPEADAVEVAVSLTTGQVDRWVEVADVRPALSIEEAIGVIVALRNNADWNAALERRGITDTSLVQIDPWPAGNFARDHEKNRRITCALAYLRDSPGDNGYARPIEGLMAYTDMGRGEVLEVVDLGVVPFPPQGGSYYPEDNGPLRTDLRPLTITQPDGPSFSVDGNLVRWQKWSLRIGMDPLEGLVLHTVGYEDGGRVRPVVFRASVSEMVVPYGDPGPMHSWKSAFDAGEWGLGRMANSLTLGCDCVGEITYFDDVFADERGTPHTRSNAICLHEEDYGILQPHRGTPVAAARRELHRHRRQLRVRLLLVLLPRRHHAVGGEADRHHVDHGRGPGRG
jgi:primary-amine oxidase